MEQAQRANLYSKYDYKKKLKYIESMYCSNMILNFSQTLLMIALMPDIYIYIFAY